LPEVLQGINEQNFLFRVGIEKSVPETRFEMTRILLKDNYGIISPSLMKGL